MNLNAARNRGFSLVEAVIATALAVVGITAVMGAYGAINAARAQAKESELKLRLALEKYDEVVATGEFEQAPLSGDFSPLEYTFSVEAEPGVATNLREVIVVVKSSTRRDDDGIEVRGIVYVPQNAVGATPAENAGGGSQ